MMRAACDYTPRFPLVPKKRAAAGTGVFPLLIDFLTFGFTLPIALWVAVPKMSKDGERGRFGIILVHKMVRGKGKDYGRRRRLREQEEDLGKINEGN
jgi:hypothetical protein